jgi:5-methylcytosine-specific restriction protein A
MPKPRPASDGFYHTPAWRALRRYALMRDHWRCVICGTNVSKPGQSRVDHIQPISTHPHLALTLANLRSLCPSCDNQAHREKWAKGTKLKETRFVVRGYNTSGMPLNKAHHWNSTDGTT